MPLESFTHLLVWHTMRRFTKEDVTVLADTNNKGAMLRND